MILDSGRTINMVTNAIHKERIFKIKVLATPPATEIILFDERKVAYV